MAEDYELIKKSDGGVKIYMSNVTGKYHMYYSCNIRKKGNIFNVSLDDIKSVTEYIYILTKDGKKALYDCSKKDEPNFIYDDIKYEDNVLILTIGDKKYIRFLSYKFLGKEEFGPFDNVFIKDGMVYCKKCNTTEIYHDSKLLLSYDNANNINLLTKTDSSTTHYRYLFEVENNDKKMIVASYYNGNEYKSRLIEGTEGSDEITVSRNIHLRFNKEYKLLIYNCYGEHLIDKKYKRIDYLVNGFYILHKNKRIDIYHENRGIVVENATCLKSITEAGIEFIKNNKRCLVTFHFHYGNIDRVKSYEDYDEFGYLSNNIYQTKKKDKKGLIINSNEEIKPNYKEIEIKTYENDKDVWILLENFNGKFELGKYNYYGDKYKTERKDLDSVEFLTNIIVIKDTSRICIIDYKGNKLKTLPKNAQISEVNEKRDNEKNKTLYKIDGDIYFYDENRFEKAKIYEQDKYITDYEDDEINIIRVETTDKELHDNLCKIIEETNLQGQAIVDKIYSDSFDMRRHHKGVVKLLKQNNNKDQ